MGGRVAITAASCAVILVEPRYPGNIGSTARVMANFGFRELHFVKPCRLEDPETAQMALSAMDIVETAGHHVSLERALTGFQFAVATTCRPGKLRNRSYDPRALAEKVAELIPANKIALVFGPEDRGLNNQELTMCQAVAAIPAGPDFPSLNLSHAVAVILWEIRRRLLGVPPSPPARKLADAAKIEKMYGHLEQALLDIGFLNRDNPRRMIVELKKILNRSGLDDRDVRIVRGIVRQLEWYIASTRGRS